MAPSETPTGQDVTAPSSRQASRSPIDPANLLDPVPMIRDLQANAPVYWSDDIRGWLITRHADVINGYRDPRMSANRAVYIENQLRYIGMGREEMPDYMNFIVNQMVTKDGADHLRMRRHASPSFSTQLLDLTVPAIRRTVNQLLDRVQERGSMELVSEMAYQLAPLVIAEFLGVPPNNHDRFQEASDLIARFGSPAPGVDFKQLGIKANQGTKDLIHFIRELYDERRAKPLDDTLSRMLKDQEQGGQISAEELITSTCLMLMAGHLTTTDQLGNAVYDLLTHPAELDKLKKDPTLLRSALEEILRFRPSLPYVSRIAREDFTLHGQSIQKDQTIFLCVVAANRDPSVFPDPDVFDINRDYTRQRHITFAFGPHACLGAGLARRELELALEILLQRMPDLRLDDTKPLRIKSNSMISRGMDEMHVQW